MKTLLNTGLGLAIVAGAFGLSAATARAESANPDGFFIAPEVVFLEFRETETAFAVNSPYDEADTVDGEIHRVGSDFELGYRFALGYRWSGNWDFTARYTTVETENSAVSHPEDGGYIYPPYMHPYDYDYIDDDGVAEAWLDQDYQQFTVEVGRTFGERHTVRAFAGLAYMSFDQNLLAHYYYDAEDKLDDEFFSVGIDSDTTAWGVRLGAEGHLALGQDSGWSLFGSAAVGVYASNLDSHTMQAYWDSADDLDELEVDVNDSQDSTMTSIEVAAGVNWMHDFDNWTFGIRFGYEMTNYSNAVPHLQFVEYDWEGPVSFKNSDLGVHGGFLRFSFLF